MQIPQEIRAFLQPTCIVVTDGRQAKLFLAADRNVEPLETIKNEHLPLGDEERLLKQKPSGIYSTDTQENLKDIAREELYHLLAERLHLMLQKKECERFVITVPEDHVNELKESLPVDVLDRVDKFIPKILTKMSLIDIIARVQEEE